MQPGSIVVLHLVDPSEKYFGVMLQLGGAGVTVRAINMSSLDDWMRSLSYDEEPAFGPATIFFPLRRVERMALDEPSGQVESLGQMIERRVDQSIRELLGLAPVEPAETETTH
ncbi:MAG: hypothetical protein AAGE94_00375 [Acidobacteriota bacterium]